MLQQTQVATVVPYFERWMQTFPDITSLAAATLDDVLSLWSGLGYYARARNLHKAARYCVENLEGELPATSEVLSALPGIGRSTANAIVSQSTDQPCPVLDGNVRRTLARHAAIRGWTGRAAVQKRLWKAAEDRLPARDGADYTQAIMDLGAMVCTRIRPSCDRCPVHIDCQALQGKEVECLPSPKPPTRVSEKIVYMLVLRDRDGRVLLEKRPPSGIWGGLWSLPEGGSMKVIEEKLGLAISSRVKLPQVEHRLSHMRMLIRPAMGTAGDATGVKCSTEHNWFAPAEQSALGLAKPISDLLQIVNEEEYE